MRLQEEFDAYCASLRARALLIAIDYAGGSTALARMAGVDRNTVHLWKKRTAIGCDSARRLSRIPGFPLTFAEMTVGMRIRRVAKRRKNKQCNNIALQTVDGCLPLLKTAYNQPVDISLRTRCAPATPQDDHAADLI